MKGLMMMLVVVIVSATTTIAVNYTTRDFFLKKVVENFADHNNKTLVQLGEILEASQVQAVMRVSVTAYSPRKEETDDTPFVNACGKRVGLGQIAVSKDLWQAGWVCGKRVWIEGRGAYIVQDRMHHRLRKTIDIFFYKTKKAFKFGKQNLVAILLKD